MNNPKFYLKGNNLQKNDTIEIMKEFSHIFKWKNDGSDTLIDIGCGPGDVTVDIIRPYLPNNYRLIYGCDLSKNMIDYAIENNKSERVVFSVMDIGEKKLKSVNLFNHLTSFFCLQWVQNQKNAFKNIYELLLPGGDFLVVFVISSNLYDVHKQISEKTQWSPYFNESKTQSLTSPYNCCENPGQEFEKIMQSAGFIDFNYEIRPKILLQNTTEDFKKFLRGCIPLSSNLSIECQEEIVQDYVNVADEINMIVNNGVEIIYDLCICYGRK